MRVLLVFCAFVLSPHQQCFDKLTRGEFSGTIYLFGLVLAVRMDTIDERSLLGIRIWAGWNLAYYLIILFIGSVIKAS